MPLGLVFDLGFGEFGRYVMWAVIAFVVYLIVSRFAFGESMPDALRKLPDRATNLLTHLDSLGLSFLKPAVTAVAQADWQKVPSAMNSAFDQLDDKRQRGAILDQLLERQLERAVGDDDARTWLLETIGKKLGVTFTPKS